MQPTMRYVYTYTLFLLCSTMQTTQILGLFAIGDAVFTYSLPGLIKKRDKLGIHPYRSDSL